MAEDPEEGAGVAEAPLALNELGPGELAADTHDGETKTASDLAPVFDVPVNISAVLGRAHMSVAQLLKLNALMSSS